ncbi:MAG: transposase, partial [Anaerolineales bacterium]|nr:transposase [Anaerolineales bacterium]
TQEEASMDKWINFTEFMRYLLDDEGLVGKGAKIIRGLLEAQSPRLTNISEKMAGNSESNYKVIQRFIKKVDMKKLLMRLYQEDAEFIIEDATEMERYKAPKTSYVGILRDGKTAGYWLMVLSTPFRGRSLPWTFVVYSSRTLGEQVTSRNQEHFRCFAVVKELLGDRPLVLDREFTYEELMEVLNLKHIQFVIRLNLGDQRKQPRLIDADGDPVKLFIKPEETVIRPNVYHLGTVKVNLIGYWRKSLSKPLWVMTSLEPKRGLEIYLKRMKIEQTFRDCKDLLHLPKLMNKKQALLEQMIALSLLTYVVGVWFGEAIRDVTYGMLTIDQLPEALLNKPPVDVNVHPKWLLYSGLFVLLKQRLRLSVDQVDAIAQTSARTFASLIFGDVRSFV